MVIALEVSKSMLATEMAQRGLTGGKTEFKRNPAKAAITAAKGETGKRKDTTGEE